MNSLNHLNRIDTVTLRTKAAKMTRHFQRITKYFKTFQNQGTGGSHLDIFRLSVMKRGSTPTCPHAPFNPSENIVEKERNSSVFTTLAVASRQSNFSRGRASRINHCSPLPVGRTCRGGLIQLYCSSCPWVLCSGLLS
jgi:hypothetical protein